MWLFSPCEREVLWSLSSRFGQDYLNAFPKSDFPLYVTIEYGCYCRSTITFYVTKSGYLYIGRNASPHLYFPIDSTENTPPLNCARNKANSTHTQQKSIFNLYFSTQSLLCKYGCFKQPLCSAFEERASSTEDHSATQNPFNTPPSISHSAIEAEKRILLHSKKHADEISLQ